MRSHARVVVIGGGVVGCSVLYHLTKLGWTDVMLVERSELTSGSTWHAAGGFHTLNADTNMAALQGYTIRLYRELEELTGMSCGLHHVGGVTLADTPERMDFLKAERAKHRYMGLETEIVGPEEIRKLSPITNVEGVIGGLYDPLDGHLDPSGTTHAYARAARMAGAEIVLRNPVLETNPRADGTWDVVTRDGTIHAEHIVNAGGLWAREVGALAGLYLPLHPMEHQYLVTEETPEVYERDEELPHVMDPSGESYLRQEGRGLCIGFYEQACDPWAVDGTPADFGHELLENQIDRIGDAVEFAYRRFPVLERAGVKQIINGPFTFSPDGNPLVGPVPGKRGYWSACAVMAGFLQGGGVGKSLAEWMVHGEPEADVYSMDVARYGSFAENREYIRQTTGQFYSRRFVMTYPNEQLPAGRPLKMAPAHDAMTAAGCRWGTSWDLEVPLYFAPSEDFVETPTLKRSNAFPIVAEECRAVRDTVGLLDITGFSRYEVSGPGAEAWLNRIFATKLPKPGRARLAVALGETGRLKGDLTLFNWGDGTWWIMGSYYLRSWHMRWFADHLDEGVTVRDLGEEVAGFSLSGPNSRKVIEKLSADPVGALPFMGCGRFDIGLIRARVARMSVTGELGFEINCRMGDHAALRRMLLDAGAEFGLREVGFNALLSLRLEKSYGIWSAEFTQLYTPGMTGMDRWIDWDKGDFVGRAEALKERDGNGPVQKIVTLEVDSLDADASGYEPVWKDGERVGFVTSGGYGHSLGKSYALAMVNTDLTAEGTDLSVHVVGIERPARVVAPSPYDPDGKAMRR